MSIQSPTFTQGRIHEIKHRKKWETNQTLKYYHYIILNKNTLQEADRYKKHKVYNRMALCIGTRNTHQCRSHHQKIVKRFGSIDDFCKNFKAKHPLLFEPTAKFYYLEEIFSNSKKPHSQNSQENIKIQSLSSINLDISDRSSSERDTDGVKGAEKSKLQLSEDFLKKSQKQYFQKTTPTGTKTSQAIQSHQRAKKLRKKRRISYRYNKLDPSLKISLSCQQSMGFLLKRQKFSPIHSHAYQQPFLSSWNDIPMGSYPSPSMDYREKLQKLTETYLDRLPQSERFNMLDDGIYYLMMMKRSQMRGLMKGMGVFGAFEQQRPFFSENEMWLMAMTQKNLEMEGTEISAKGEQINEKTCHCPKIHQEQFFPNDYKATELPFRHQQSHPQLRNSEPMMSQYGLNGEADFVSKIESEMS